ncbi:hypothetical protein OCGS_0247 [Oceaniovalibus guishaninsula JLT2003]|uniref:Lipopolysaccharide assembly protein A domain-containing protein n=1 Tax=Oceaniovalibus guishaninsula JLT2003 TaxID=1231392 RepID=K2I9K1_9RHOB|nr:lipopolysaccharide assembly protein LapA domain-containing protein [Oceaniovalibus guishaninsula]EKE45630.1 hypothetical protein OCGS_0247 [Oceaniovalibus guishaninsula JLT2003]
MTYVKYALLILLGVILVTVALANAGMVTLRLLPVSMAGFLGWSWLVRLPLFIVILASVLVGVLVGFVWEWAREHKHRAAARHERREKEQLQREVTQLRARPLREGDDDVLVLVEDRPAIAAR